MSTVTTPVLPEIDQPPTTRPTPGEVVERLELLGSADAIAAFLEAQGITGWKGCALACAIARYIERETGGPWVVWGLTGGPNVRGFINNFDLGDYPKLVESGPCDCRPNTILF